MFYALFYGGNMRAVITCPDPENPIFIGSDIACSNGATPQLEAVFYGLGSLAWSDVGLLIAALTTSCALATGINILARGFNWK